MTARADGEPEGSCSYEPGQGGARLPDDRRRLPRDIAREFTLGEIGYVDDDGYVFITDRFSDMVVSGGANIYPAEAEQVLIEHPAVQDVACIGVPHPDMGEELKALVIPVDPAAAPDPAELIRFCRDRLSHYKCPRSVDYVDDLGRNAMGKINKRTLRAPYWQPSA